MYTLQSPRMQQQQQHQQQQQQQQGHRASVVSPLTASATKTLSPLSARARSQSRSRLNVSFSENDEFIEDQYASIRAQPATRIMPMESVVASPRYASRERYQGNTETTHMPSASAAAAANRPRIVPVTRHTEIAPTQRQYVPIDNSRGRTRNSIMEPNNPNSGNRRIVVVRGLHPGAPAEGDAFARIGRTAAAAGERPMSMVFPGAAESLPYRQRDMTSSRGSSLTRDNVMPPSVRAVPLRNSMAISSNIGMPRGKSVDPSMISNKHSSVIVQPRTSNVRQPVDNGEFSQRPRQSRYAYG